MQHKPNLDKFIAAINSGDIATLQNFIDQGASLDAIDGSGYPLFYHAISSNKRDVINFFLNNFKTVEEVNASERQHVGITPLGAAAQYASKYGDDNSFDYITRLITAGARLNPDNSSSPIVDAIKFDGPFSYKVVDFLTEYDNHKQDVPNKYELPLITAVKMGNLEMVQLLLSKFANMAILGRNCNYIIKEAIISNNLDIVKYLIEMAQNDKIPFDQSILIQEITNHYNNSIYAITKCLNFLKIKHTFRHGEFVLTTQDYGNEVHRSGNTPTIKQVTRTCIIDHKICSKETHEVLDTTRISEREQAPLYVINKKGELFVGEIGNHSFFLKGTKGKTMLGDRSFYGYGKTVACAGHIRFKYGLITAIDFNSGHYRPNLDQLKLVCKHFYDLGVLSPDFVAKDHLNKVVINSSILQTLDTNDILDKYPSIGFVQKQPTSSNDSEPPAPDYRARNKGGYPVHEHGEINTSTLTEASKGKYKPKGGK